MTVKAFELISVLERVTFNQDRNEQLSRSEIECVDALGKSLFIGTSDGFVVLYTLSQKVADEQDRKLKGDRPKFECQLCRYKAIGGTKRPIEQVLAVSATKQVLVLSDASVHVLSATNLEILPVHNPIKSALCLSLNVSKDGSSNSVSAEVCVAIKKKAVQLYSLTEEQLVLLKEIALPEPASLVNVCGSLACLALQTRYVLADCRTGKVTVLFPFDEETTDSRPLVKAVGEGEFLLGGPSGLGMFITTAGIARRPPLALGSNLYSVAYSHPYIVSMSDRTLAVHSILDQQQKQTIPFQTGRGLAEMGERIIVASSKSLFALMPVPLSKQVQALLAERRVDEALALARSAVPTTSGNNETLRMVEQQAGFIEFAAGHLDEARALFVSSDIDIRQIIALFPGLPAEGVTHAKGTLFEVANVEHLCKGDAAKLERYKKFLISYIENGFYSSEAKKDAHTALLKLYAERRSSELTAFAEGSFEGHSAECIGRLMSCGCHHATAVLHLRAHKAGEALEIWARLLQGDLRDVAFDDHGLPYVAKVITSLQDHELVMKYCDLVLNRDQLLGATIFTKRLVSAQDSGDLQPEAVIERLQSYQDALIAYLEYLVFDRKLQKETYHTHLAMLYLDCVLDIIKRNEKPTEDLKALRTKLQAVLQSTAAYRAQLLLARIYDKKELSSLLLEERASLHGRLGQHEQALRILALQLDAGSLAAARRYCLLHSTEAGSGRAAAAADTKQLFYVLASIYVDEATRDQRFVAPAVDLLNSPESLFDAVKVLKLIPEDWSITLVAQFLTNSACRSLSESRAVRVHRGLLRRASEKVHQQFLSLRSRRVTLAEDSVCDFCKRMFTEPSFVRLANGAICHVGTCAKSLGGGRSLLPEL